MLKPPILKVLVPRTSKNGPLSDEGIPVTEKRHRNVPPFILETKEVGEHFRDKGKSSRGGSTGLAEGFQGGELC